MVGENLVGGNIEGLHTIGASVLSASEPFASSREAVNNAVDRVVHDAGWYGNAAKSMRAAWAVDTTKVGILADATRWCGRAITELASRLEELNSQLYDAAYRATKAGVRIAPDGTPFPLTGAASLLAVQASGQYSATRRGLLDEARSARGLAYARLASLVGALEEPLSKDPAARTWVQAQNILRGLYTAPDKAADVTRAAGLKDLAEKLPGSHEMRTGIKPLPGFLKSVPILSWMSTGVSAGLKTQDDIQRGWNPAGAAAVEYGAGITGTIAGVATSGAIVAGVGVGTTAGAAVATVSFGVVAGAVVASGVGGAISQVFHENWAHDIDEHGVVGGVATGIGHVLHVGGQEAVNTVTSIGDVAGSLWKGLTGQ